MERYTPEEARAEADVLEGKIASGEAETYEEADQLLQGGETTSVSESKVDKDEAHDKSRERGEALEGYLEQTIFPRLQLTEVDRHKSLEKAVAEGKTPEELSSIDRSFENIRESLRIGLIAYCDEIKQDPSTEVVTEFLNNVQQHAERNLESAKISYTVDLDGLIDAVASGSFKGITALDPEALERVMERRSKMGAWSKQYRGGPNSPYIQGRRKIEKELGYSEGVEYGELVIGPVYNDIGAYGEVTLEIAPRKLGHLLFCEGDSLQISSGAGVIANEKSEKIPKEEDHVARVVASARKRILTLEHAMISRAITDVLDAARARISDGTEAHIPGGGQGYLEAHIIGELPVDSEAITSVLLGRRSIGRDLDYLLKNISLSTPIRDKIRYGYRH